MVVDVRLPGIRFEPQPPPPTEILPRMDIAAFVGYAERGPLDTPVPVEDLSGFRDVFGGEVPLAWDPERGESVAGHLYAAVNAFFRNGGVRCWIVRVAGPGVSTARFAIPGMLQLLPRAAGPTGRSRLVRAQFQASSPGSWSDRYVASASIAATPLPIVGAVAVRRSPPAAGTTGGRAAYAVDLRLDLAGAPDAAPGDVLRARMDDGRVAFLPVVSIARDRSGTGATVATSAGAWFKARPPAPGTPADAAWTDADGTSHAAPATIAPVDAWPLASGFATDIPRTGADWPVPGSWVRVSIDRRRWWLLADDTGTIIQPDGTEVVRVRGAAYQRTGPRRDALVRTAADAVAGIGTPAAVSRSPVELIRLTLWAGDGRLDAWRSDLGLGGGHPRAASALPTDDRLFGGDPERPWTAPEAAGDTGSPIAAARGSRFPLAGLRGPGFLVPLFLDSVPLRAAGPLPRLSGTDPDGTLTASSEVFLDPALHLAAPADLLAHADFLRYQSPTPRRLRGIHALLGVEEVSLVAVPDAAAPTWTRGSPPLPAIRRFDRPPVEACDPFQPCDPGAPPVPRPRIRRDPNSRSFTVEWLPSAGSSAYEVETSTEPTSWQAPVVTRVRLARHRVLHPAAGRYVLRVRALGERHASAWSDPVRITVGSRAEPVIDNREDTAGALRVHAALLRMCAARGDLFALLSLPQGAATATVLAHLDALRRDVTGIGDRGDPRAPDLDPANVLSYGALYHPWVVALVDPAAPSRGSAGPGPGQGAGQTGTDRSEARRPGRDARPPAIPRSRPPDGAVAGVYADRARGRGAWVAAANVALRDVVALERPPDDEDLVRLHVAGVNVVRRLPTGFLVHAAETLSGDPLLLQANVRRLLSLLRRLALRHGATYVFEPNSGGFRRRIERGFEAILGLLYERGAFAGASAAEGYRVVVGDPPNTVQGVDAGRLVVELKVAPSLPLQFLTVRLVRSGERLAVEVA